MSHIFQTTPPAVKVHHLPKGAEFFTYQVTEFLNISAWMPDNFHTVNQHQEMSNSDFYHQHCAGCERNTAHFLTDYMDEDGEVDEAAIPGECSHCYVYENGYDGQTCPEGYELEDTTFTLPLANTVFQVSLKIKEEDGYNRFTRATDTAYLCAGRIAPSGRVYATPKRRSANVYGDSNFPGHICWGGVERPESLREIANNYATSPFNNDLLRLETFEKNCRFIRDYVLEDNFSATNHTFLCSGDNVDSLLIVEADKDISAFFTLLTAGFKSLSDLPHIMMVPAEQCHLNRDGNTYFGYLTVEDELGKRWFVSEDLQLIGQV